jgi:hypothetical protein
MQTAATQQARADDKDLGFVSNPSDVLLAAAAHLECTADALARISQPNDEAARDSIWSLRRHALAIRVEHRNMSMEWAS